jgi:SAM-dependent methyltransferase
MPTLAPHQARGIAESFGVDADRYDRARPRYPDELIERIVRASPGPAVLDAGIGTGISALPFGAAGCRVLGVDPDERMAEVARRRGFAVEVATFEEWDPAGRRFDAVVAGMTWHWVDPAAGARKAAEVLRPGGRFAAFWNIAEPPGELAQAFSQVYRRVLPGTPFATAAASSAVEGYEPILSATADGLQAAGAFTAPERWRVDWERTYTTDEWLDQVPTLGGHGRLAPGQLEAVLDGIAAAVDAAGGRFTMRYAAIAVTAARRTAS